MRDLSALAWITTIVLVTGAAVSRADAADLPVSYLVEEKPLKAAAAGTPLAFELYSDNTCTTLVESVPVNVENVTILSKLKQMTPKDDTKLPNTVELRTTLTGITPEAAVYLKVTDSGGAVVPVAGPCQAQASGVVGAPGPTGPTGSVGAPGNDASSVVVLFAATDQSVANGNFVGAGTSSATFVRNSIVVPFNGVITSLTFHGRSFVSFTPVTLTLYAAPSGSVTSIAPLNGSSATSVSCSASGSSFTCTAGGLSVAVGEGDLISGRLSSSSSMSDGLAWSAVLSPN